MQVNMYGAAIAARKRSAEQTAQMYMPGFEKEDLKECYPEFVALEEQCRFTGCSHIHEPDCAVKEALSEGKISTERYENYCTLYEEIKDTKKY